MPYPTPPYRVAPTISQLSWEEARTVLPDDCRIRLAIDDPHVRVIDHFLTDDECDALIAQYDAGLKRMGFFLDRDGNEVIDDRRTAYGKALERGSCPIMECFEQRLEAVTLWPKYKTERSSFVRYEYDEGIRGHHDFFGEGKQRSRALDNGGQRVGTMVMYLNDTHGDGGTCFDRLGICVYPKKGSLLFFNYPIASADNNAHHLSTPVVGHTKYVIIKWFREDFIDDAKLPPLCEIHE